MTLREALSQFVARRCEALPVVDAEGQMCIRDRVLEVLLAITVVLWGYGYRLF